jgi:hypothetical protein
LGGCDEEKIKQTNHIWDLTIYLSIPAVVGCSMTPSSDAPKS